MRKSDDEQISIEIHYYIKFYLPGETIRGWVNLTPKNTFLFDDITVCMKGNISKFEHDSNKCKKHYINFKIMENYHEESSKYSPNLTTGTDGRKHYIALAC